MGMVASTLGWLPDMDTSVLNVLGRARRVGPSKSDDTGLITTGTVYAVDPLKAIVQVGVGGGAVWLPAIAARYQYGALARVLMDPTSGRPVHVVGPVNPRPPIVGAPVAATGTGDITVTFDGEPVQVQATGSYTVGESAWVMLDDWGMPVYGVAPFGSLTSGGSGSGGAPGAPSTAVAKASIGPQWSGTWKAAQSRWNSWNTDRYGGPSDIYQGDAYGSGLLVGFAGYGDQVVNLGAITIDEVILRARKNDTNGLSAQLQVQGSPWGSQPPGYPPSSGDILATGSIPPGGWGDLGFSAGAREAFRTGAAKGLVAVGGQYGGFGGTGTPGSFVLDIRYTRPI